ncbi:MAG: VCBS repeat-containing protein [Bryobacteraceae bacterium]
MAISLVKLAPLPVVALALFAVSRPPEVPFKVHSLDLGGNEPAALADINKDGKVDIVSGENWYEAPTWKQHHFRDLPYANNYIDDFSDLPVDVNGDGDPDIVSVHWFAKKAEWWKNPGKGGGKWTDTTIDDGHPIEFAFLADLNNDGKALELLPQWGDDKAPLTWYEVKDGAWVKHTVSDRSYGHGIGAGDVNGDHRTDILTPQGWFEAPPDPRNGKWIFHPDWSEKEALGFLHVTDVDGDGRNDVVTSYAHNYGIFWMKQGTDGKFTKNLIDDSWSQAHAVSLVDVNGDGRLDILTGKRYMAHNGHDPGEKEPLGIYWYESVKTADGKIDWARHVIEYGSRVGGGMQIPAADLDSDGDIDFVVGGKSGLFLFENLTKRASK